MTSRPRVVVLGGGVAGLTSAWRLSEPGWHGRFSSITVVERSSRLGGKGASTRGAHGRIEEHGLHVWLGHYDNAFRLIRECYAELDRERTDPLCPIRTWRDAFLPAGQLGLFDEGPGGWKPWVATFTPNRQVPGELSADGHATSVVEMLLRSALLIRDFYLSLGFGGDAVPAVSLSTSRVPPRSSVPQTALRAAAATAIAVSQQLVVLAGIGARRLAGPGGAAAIDAAFEPLLTRLRQAIHTDVRARRLHDLVDLVRSVLSGMAADGLGEDRDAYDAINHLDFRDWLRSHGAQESTLRSAIVRGQYDLVFSHEDGDPARPRFAAGWGVNLSAKLWFDYKGSIFWKMRAGMGDVVFAPLYQALRDRGVAFRFFSEVEEVVPSSDGSSIGSVILKRTRPELADTYEPLTRIKGLPCFRMPADLPPGTESREVLHRGTDFDLVVFAIPPAVARVVCRRIASQRPSWKTMLDRLGTVATHAFQLWLTPDERALGWAHPGTTVSAFAKPFDTWASMSHLIGLEDWENVGPPGTLAYFCSTLSIERARGDAMAHTRAQAIGFLDRYSRYFWPNAVDPATGGMRWDVLCTDEDVAGPERFATQFWTSNTDPSDLYVQSLPETDAYRLRPDDSGFANLFLAGDWTDCGINAGCIEAAVVSGLQAANGVLDRPRWDGISGRFLR